MEAPKRWIVGGGWGRWSRKERVVAKSPPWPGCPARDGRALAEAVRSRGPLKRTSLRGAVPLGPAQGWYLDRMAGRLRAGTQPGRTSVEPCEIHRLVQLPARRRRPSGPRTRRVPGHHAIPRPTARIDRSCRHAHAVVRSIKKATINIAEK